MFTIFLHITFTSGSLKYGSPLAHWRLEASVLGEIYFNLRITCQCQMWCILLHLKVNSVNSIKGTNLLKTCLVQGSKLKQIQNRDFFFYNAQFIFWSFLLLFLLLLWGVWCFFFGGGGFYQCQFCLQLHPPYLQAWASSVSCWNLNSFKKSVKAWRDEVAWTIKMTSSSEVCQVWSSVWIFSLFRIQNTENFIHPIKLEN